MCSMVLSHSIPTSANLLPPPSPCPISHPPPPTTILSLSREAEDLSPEQLQHNCSALLVQVGRRPALRS